MEQQIATVLNYLKENNEEATYLAAQLKEEALMKASALSSIEKQKEEIGLLESKLGGTIAEREQAEERISEACL